MGKQKEIVCDNLYQKVGIQRGLQRGLSVAILFLLISLLGYRIWLLFGSHGFCWVYAIAFVCECWFTFNWALIINITWSPINYDTYPQRLLDRMNELPPVDVFVTTADPVLEPPIITVNTVLSVLAAEYPANKLACYVSDDGGSPVTFYSLSEAVNFAKIWVPFCNKYKVQVRAPFRYFLDDLAPAGSTEFQSEWNKMKDEYEELRERIEEAITDLRFGRLVGELADFVDIKPNNHAPIIKIIWENKGLQDGLPHLVYVSREKRPHINHRFKAGAMNVLTRVSGLMTNAPYILNLDCDMFVNNSNVLLQAMCLLQDPIIDKEYAFVQFPQCFYNGLKDDPFGNQWIILMKLKLPGMAGIQGPAYIGTGCVHRRKVLYGLSPDEVNINEKLHCDDELIKTFGNSKDFVTSVVRALKSVGDHYPNCLSNSIKATNGVATAHYEYNSSWGSKVGWQYGSLVEDILTGMEIHKKGWKSAYIAPTPPAFLGCAPAGGPAPLTHHMRMLTGLLEILTGEKSPIFNVNADKLRFRQRLFYVWMYLTAVSAVPQICYSTLPAFSLIANSHFLPNVQEPAICIPLLLFVLLNLSQLLEYYETGQSTRAWWNNHRMERIQAMSSSLLGMVAVLLKTLGLSETVFEVTKKDSFSSLNTDEDLGQLTFDESPLFVPVTTVLMIQLAGLSIGILGMEPRDRKFGVGEVTCSVWLALCFWPFMKGMFATGKYGLPWFILFKSSVLAFLFVYFCEINKFPL